MRVLITGIDGYLGWPLALYLRKRGHEIAGIDNYARRRWVKEVGSQSAIPIPVFPERMRTFQKIGTHYPLQFWNGDLTNYDFVSGVYKEFNPETIVYLGEMPSAAYSMLDVWHATYTQSNNVLGTIATLHAIKEFCPQAHLVKLGTMGEYGTPNCSIPEGSIPSHPCEYVPHTIPITSCPMRGLMFPRHAGSWYHQSKVHDTHNTEMACRFWKLRATDIMQGVVYGTQTDETQDNPDLATRFDFDECFGTVINRFCAQAVIGMPLTVYGTGGQQRGFLPLRDSMQCLGIAIENPPSPGEYRVFNQFASVCRIYDLAKAVKLFAKKEDLDVEIQPVENPRIESEKHNYTPESKRLRKLGYVPTDNIPADIREIIQDLKPHAYRLRECQDVLKPKIKWREKI